MTTQPTSTNIDKMNKLKFSKDEGSDFYRELTKELNIDLKSSSSLEV